MGCSGYTDTSFEQASLTVDVEFVAVLISQVDFQLVYLFAESTRSAAHDFSMLSSIFRFARSSFQRLIAICIAVVWPVWST
jgi:hypothetical protein